MSKRSFCILLLMFIGWLCSKPGYAAELSGILSIAAGGSHTCALTAGGAVKCWGRNSSGQLGDGTVGTNRLAPVDVTGLGSGMIAIAAGGSHTCALTSGGGVKCWGANGGRLGDGTVGTNRLAPVDVTGLGSGMIAIAAGGFHTCALTSGGGVKCWGANGGQLGDGTWVSRPVPVDVVGLSNGVTAIAAGESFTCALASGGAVKCWGSLTGNGTNDMSNVPVDVSGLAGGVAAIAAGDHHTCALTLGGAVKCWGNNFNGQLGNTTAGSWLAPLDVVGLGSGVIAIVAGGLHTCALTSGGAAKCWGDNNRGQLGDTTRLTRRVPVDVAGLDSGVVAIAAGYYHTCALTSAGVVKCWGDNSFGQLGDLALTLSLMPVDALGLASGVRSISTGNSSTCALTSVGAAKCWGYGSNVPIDVAGLSGGLVAIAAGGSHFCAIASGGAAKCWGNNTYGQVGDTTTLTRNAPVDVAGLSSGVTAIATGSLHTCALTADGAAKCWGDNSYGQLGDNTHTPLPTFSVSPETFTPTPRPTPVDVSGLASGVSAITAGARHTCALTSAGAVKCWGDNAAGQLGDASTTQRLAPVDVAGLGSGVAAIAAGYDHTCALTLAGAVKCWGKNGWGQLGDTTTTQRLAPVDGAGLATDVTAISTGSYHTCALTAQGAMKCWGYNANGQIGDMTTTQRSAPVGVAGLASVVTAIAAGGSHTCALTSGGAVKCWGYRANGQLGDGTSGGTRRLFPAPVVSAVQANYSDSWWNASESGWGLNITDHGTNLFVQWFSYDETGHNQKYVIPGGTFSSDKCRFSGSLQHVTGPSWTLPTFDPNQVTRATAGSANIDFCPTGLPVGTLVFSYTADGVTGSKQMTRLPFGNDVPHWAGWTYANGFDFTDLWWNPNESGWGVSLTQHGNNVFVRIYVYDTDGRPLLFVMSTVTFNSPTSFTGALHTTTGPWFGSDRFDPNQVMRTTVGTATLTFSDLDNGVLSYTVNGVTKTKPITRLVF